MDMGRWRAPASVLSSTTEVTCLHPDAIDMQVADIDVARRRRLGRPGARIGGERAAPPSVAEPVRQRECGGALADAGKIARQAEMNSNGVENLIRPIALTRKNALFAGYDEGGRSWARIASLIATARINNVEPFAYLKGTLEAVAAGRPPEKIDDLLPWNFMPSR